MKNKNYRIILASTSPRRIEMFRALGLEFEMIPPNFEEKRTPNEDPVDYALRNSVNKALSVLSSLKHESKLTGECLIISADTIVLIDGMVLEKPSDPANAREMLRTIAGRTHTVVTALSVIKADAGHHDIHSQTVTTEVTLAPVTEQEITNYVATGEPLDKAGSYAIQGKGGYMVDRIDGSYSNVVGLPLSDLVAMLKTKFAIDFSKRFYTT